MVVNDDDAGDDGDDTKRLVLLSAGPNGAHGCADRRVQSRMLDIS